VTVRAPNPETKAFIR